MNGISSFEMPPKILYGRDSRGQLGKTAAAFGDKALIVSDRIMEQAGYVSACRELLEAEGLACAYYLDANTEPTDGFVTDALEIAHREQCNVVVALGGGSCIDTAKAVAVLSTNGGSIGEYVGRKRLATVDPLPLIAVPTTAGTGSEVTNVTVITNTEQGVKMMIKQSAFLPKAAIVDPLLTLTCPESVSSASGLDALCHAVESYLSNAAHPMTRIFSLSAIEIIARSIVRVCEDGKDVDAREQMALAAMEAGLAFSNSSVTLVHGMSRPIGALFHVPHGISNAMLLPAVLEFTRDAAIEQLAVIGRLIAPDAAGGSDSECAAGAIGKIKALYRELDVPNLRDWGIERGGFEQSLDKMATDALASGSPGYNPRVPTHDEIVGLYKRCYDYDLSTS